MLSAKVTTPKLALSAVLGFAMSGFMMYSWVTFSGIPPRLKLLAAAGPVSWVHNGKYGIKFGLVGVSKSFEYSSKSNAMGVVAGALEHSGRAVVTVLYDPEQPTGPVYSSDVYYGVFEISIDGRVVQSHEQIARAWRSDQRIAPWLAVGCALAGMYLSWAAVRRAAAT